MSIRVLMVGPGEGIAAGISALVETLMPVLERQVDLLYFPTVKQRPEAMLSVLHAWVSLIPLRFCSDLKFTSRIFLDGNQIT